MLDRKGKRGGLWAALIMDKPAIWEGDSKKIVEFPGERSQEGTKKETKEEMKGETKTETMEVVLLPIEKISPNPDQPRRIFREEELKELSLSIGEYGILQPIIVKPAGAGTYFLIAGERRYRAATLAGLTEIPAIVRTMEEEDAAVIALVENVQRENLNYIEEAKAYKKLMDEFHLTQGEIARKVGKQQSTISNKIRILALPEDIQKVLTENRLTERHARALLKITEENDRRRLVDRVVKNQLNVKQTEKLIEDLLASQEEQRRRRKKVNYISYKIYVNTIRKAFIQIKELEKEATLQQEDKGEFLELKIRIPKKDRCFT